jgi:MATE family multidrug resistance protein
VNVQVNHDPEQAPLTHRRVIAIAWPIILANLAVPLLGIVDTAVVGHLGSAAPLGAIAIAAQVFSFLYWGLGFLRMGTTGLTAQADGARDAAEVAATLSRSLLIAVVLGIGLILARGPLGAAAFLVFRSSPEIERLASCYFFLRIWGAPATLIGYAVTGWFIGVRATRLVLVQQLFLNALNIGLDLLFVVGLGWGVRGVALGTLIAEWSAALLALGLVVVYRRRSGAPDQRSRTDLSHVLQPRALLATLRVNRDIFLRTLLLIGAFAWFTRQGALAGEMILAANYVLLQLLTFSAFFLDGFAFAAEGLVGQAVGGRSRAGLRAAVRLSSHLAMATAATTALAFAVGGPWIIDGLTGVAEVREAARRFLPYAVLHPLVGWWCFQLDGVFIGATRTADMRNAMIISFLAYLGLWRLLWTPLGNHGLWISFILFFIIRGVTLAVRYGALLRSIDDRG